MSAPQTAAEPTNVSLFQPITLGSRTFRNRLWLSPMCQYSAEDGVPGQWHLVHLGARAKGGFGLIFAEATAVSPEARISLADTGLWTDQQEQAWQDIVEFVHERGARIGIQLSHAGRKASLRTPWEAEPGALPVEDGGWTPLSASPIAFPGSTEPTQASDAQLRRIVDDFASSTVRARGAGFDVVEIQAGHGFLLEVVDAVNEVLGNTGPSLFVRLSATDWLDHGLSVHDSAEISQWLRKRGVDLVDVALLRLRGTVMKPNGYVPAPKPFGHQPSNPRLAARDRYRRWTAFQSRILASASPSVTNGSCAMNRSASSREVNIPIEPATGSGVWNGPRARSPPPAAWNSS